MFNQKVQINPKIWHYAIHSENPEMISFLEENKIQPPSGSFENCLDEALKCHHNNIANYFLNNLSCNEGFNNKVVVSKAYKYHNYQFIPNIENLDDNEVFVYACKYGYLNIVKIILNEKKIDFKEKIISKYL